MAGRAGGTPEWAPHTQWRRWLWRRQQVQGPQIVRATLAPAATLGEQQ